MPPKSKPKGNKKTPGELEDDEEALERKAEIYELVQRSLLVSQLEAVCQKRSRLLGQRRDLEESVRTQAASHGEVEDFLQKKVQANFENIAALEDRVAQERAARQEEETRMADSVSELISGRLLDKQTMEARQVALEAELAEVRRFLDHKWEFEEELEGLQQQLKDNVAAHQGELAGIHNQLIAEKELRQREIEEKISVARKAVALELQEQLGATTKSQMTENKKIAQELRFQCKEIDKFRAKRDSLVADTKRMASELHTLVNSGAQLARATHAMQVRIRSMAEEVEKEEKGDAGTVITALTAAGDSQQIPLSDRIAALPWADRTEAMSLLQQLQSTTVAIEAANIAAQVAKDQTANIIAQARDKKQLRLELARLARWCQSDAIKRATDGTEDLETSEWGVWPLRAHVIPKGELSETVRAEIAGALHAVLQAPDMINPFSPTHSQVVDGGVSLPPVQGALPRPPSAGRPKTTGIPSWDALQPIVKHLKKSYTRNVAVQTMSFMEMRDEKHAKPAAPAVSAPSTSGHRCLTCGKRLGKVGGVEAVHYHGNGMSPAPPPGLGYKGVALVTLTDQEDRLQSAFRGRRARASAKDKAAFISQRGGSLAGSSIQGGSSIVSGSITSSLESGSQQIWR